ncbi:MAG: hypothetical protein ACLF0G_10830 [Candidatus Brocadiia bacterium]
MWPFRRKPRPEPEPESQEPEPREPEAEPPPPQAPPSPGRGRTAADVLRELEEEAEPEPVEEAADLAVDPNVGRCLLAEGPVTREFLRQQLAVSGKADSYLGQLVGKCRAPREERLFRALAAGYEIPTIDLKQCRVRVSVARSISREIALKYKVVPIDRLGDLLCVVFSGKPNPKALEAIRRATGLRVKALRCPPHHLKLLLRRLFLGRPSGRKALRATSISDQEYQRLAHDPGSRVEARWEAIHASKGPIRAVRFERR